MITLFDKLFGIFLGLEFKEDAIVVTFLNNDLSGMSVLSSSTFALGDHETTANEIWDYIRQHGTDINKVFVSITDKWAITKFIDIPSMKGKGKNALANLMRFEIERHIPFEIDEVTYDFLVVDEAGSQCSTVFVVVQNQKIEFVKDFLERLSLEPDAITLSSFAVLNTVELSGVSAGGWQDIVGIVRKSDVLGKKGELNVCINFERMHVSMSVIRDGLCCDMKLLMMRSGQSARDIAEDIVNHLEAVPHMFNVEIINRLLLTGDDDHMSGVTDELEVMIKEKGVNVNQVVKFAGDLRGVKMNGLSSSVGACFAGLGIGTYPINLLPHEGGYEIKKIAPLATKVFLVLAVLLIFGIFATEAVKQKNALHEIEATLKENEPIVKTMQDMSAEINALKKRSSFLNNIIENDMMLEILAELANVLPSDAWITNLNFKGFKLKEKKKDGGQLIINGYAVSSSILIPLLEDSPLFEKVAFVGPIKKTKNKEQFKLSAKIIKPSGLELKSNKPDKEKEGKPRRKRQ